MEIPVNICPILVFVIICLARRSMMREARFARASAHCTSRSSATLAAVSRLPYTEQGRWRAGYRKPPTRVTSGGLQTRLRHKQGDQTLTPCGYSPGALLQPAAPRSGGHWFLGPQLLIHALQSLRCRIQPSLAGCRLIFGLAAWRQSAVVTALLTRHRPRVAGRVPRPPPRASLEPGVATGFAGVAAGRKLICPPCE